MNISRVLDNLTNDLLARFNNRTAPSPKPRQPEAGGEQAALAHISSMIDVSGYLQQDMQAEAKDLVAKHTHYLGADLDEEGLGRELAGRVAARPELARAVYSQLSNDNKVQVARAMIGALSDDELRSMVWAENGRGLLHDLNRWVANNSLTGEGRSHAATDLRLRERIGVALTRTDDITMVAPPPSSASKPERISQEGIELLTRFEGFRSLPYNDTANNATIGYGHLLHMGPVNDADKARYGKGLSEAEATELLRVDLAEAESAVKRLVTVPLTQNQFNALVSFTYNVGGGALEKSTLLRELNKGNYDAVPGEMSKWVNSSGKETSGLVNRRKEEGELFSRK